MKKIKLSIAVLFLLFIQNSFAQYNLTVDKSATPSATVFNTVQAAINAVPTGQTVPYTIFVKNGKYREKITVPSNKPFVQLIGESVANVFIYYDDYAGLAGGTSNSASFRIDASDFSAYNITFANTFDYDAGVTAGITGLQAVAVLVNGDRVAFKNCRFIGEQDTLYQNKKGYYKNCYIDGIIDFIFGGGASIFEECTILPKSRTGNGTSYITAANTPAGQAYGYVFRDSKIISNPGGTNYYLGRPWQNSTGSTTPFAENKTVLLNTILNTNVLPVGWSVWDAGTLTSNITYAEYQSKYFNNALVDISNRASWSQQLNITQAAAYTNANIFAAGTPWDPCVIYPNICNTVTPDIAIANLKSAVGVGFATFKWNISWGIPNVKFELFRSLVRNGTYTKINEVITPNDTTYHYSLTDNALPPGQEVYYYLYNTASGYASNFSDTIKVSTKPTINTQGSLGAFQQGGYTPSASQNYIVNGINLADNIVITPPANFEISLNNATWTNSTGNITLPPTSGVITNTTIYVRLNAATAPGSFSGNILHTTTNGDNVNVALTGTSQVAPLTAPAYFRSKANGNLSDVNTWETSADSLAWSAATFVPIGDAAENVTLMPSFTVNVDVAHTVNGKWTVFGSGANIGGAYTLTGGSLTFANNSSLVWNRDGGTLTTGTVFNAGSTFNLIGTGNGTALPTGTTTLLPTINASQVFHHFIINIPNSKANSNFNGTLNTINGNLVIISTGTYGSKIRLTNSPTQVINIGGDLIINPEIAKHATFIAYSTTSIATTQALNIAGNIYVGNNYVSDITGTNGTFSSGSTAVTLSAANPNIVAGMGVTGLGIATNSYVVSVSGTSLTLSSNTTAAGTGVALTFKQATSNLQLTDAGTSITATGTYTSGSFNITLSAANPSILAGMNISGTGIVSGTTVVSNIGTTLTISNRTNAPGSAASLTINNTLSKINLNGNLTVNNGTISNSGIGLGTINFAGNTGVPQFYNRTLGSVTSGGITVNVLPNAILDVNTSVLPTWFNLNTGATLRTAHANGILGNITNTGKVVFSSAANYVFNGTVAQSALNNFTTTTPAALTVNSIIINNAAGVTLGNSLTTSALNLTTGKLTLGAANLTTNAITGGSANSFVVTDATGKLKINAVPLATNVSFPVGISTTSYTPVSIKNNGTTADNFSINVSTGIPTGAVLDSTINRIWNISEDVAGGTNATITLQWNTADQNSLFNTSNCAVVHSNGTSIDATGAFSNATNPSAGEYTVTGSGFTSFSPFGVTSKPGAALPLTLISFDGEQVNDKVNLKWTTSNEINTSHFEIQKSYNGIDFEKLGTVIAYNNTNLNSYTYVDTKAINDIIYYKLKMVDVDGSFKWSNIIAIKTNSNKLLVLSPNPVLNYTYLIHDKATTNAAILLYSTNGKLVYTKPVKVNNTSTKIETNTLPAGIYNVVFYNNNKSQSILLIKK